MLEEFTSQSNLPLEIQFQRENFRQKITETRDIEKLKEITLELLDTFYNSREFIKQLMLKDLPSLPRK